MIPVINQTVIDTTISEWYRLNKNPFEFCAEQISRLGAENPNLLLAVDILLKQVFINNESDDVPEVMRELNRARALAVMMLVIKMINNQMEVDELYEIYNN